MEEIFSIQENIQKRKKELLKEMNKIQEEFLKNYQQDINTLYQKEKNLLKNLEKNLIKQTESVQKNLTEYMGKIEKSHWTNLISLLIGVLITIGIIYYTNQQTNYQIVDYQNQKYMIIPTENIGKVQDDYILIKE